MRSQRRAVQGVRVTPVVDAAHPPDFSHLPRALAAVHALDPTIDEQWRQLVRILEGEGRVERVPFLAPDPPDRFVPRNAEYEALKQALLDDANEAVAITAALRGAGGFGKTTLARALVHDDDMQAAYYHGILWTELGEEPRDLVGTLNRLTRTLNPQATSPADMDLAVAEWRAALEHKRCLIVVDDVWRRADLEPFLQGGPDCARLVTTRDAAVLPHDRSKLREVPVDEMKEDEAFAMLARDLDPAAVARCRAELSALAKDLGEWMLLLDLANVVLLDMTELGGDLAEEIADLRREYRERGVSAFDPADPDARAKAAAGAIERSLKALARENASHPDRLLDLAVFPEDTDIPSDLIAALWSSTAALSARDARLLGARLARMSLLTSFDLATRTARLHDVLRKYLRDRIGPGRLKELDGLVAEAIIAASGGKWEALRDDAYALAHLPAHLWAAGRTEELDDLLLDLSWIETKLSHGLKSGEGAAPLLLDYLSFARDPAAAELGRILRLIAPDLAQDGPAHLAPQLLGRLDASERAQFEELCATARTRLSAGMLYPARPTLRDQGRELLRLRGHGGAVRSVAFSPDGARLATGSDDGTARLWDAATGAELARMRLDTAVSAVACSPDGRTIAVGDTVGRWHLLEIVPSTAQSKDHANA